MVTDRDNCLASYHELEHLNLSVIGAVVQLNVDKGTMCSPGH